MTAKKKIIIAAVSVVVAAGGVYGGYKINEARKKRGAVADVVPVSYLNGGYWGNGLQLEGVITSGNVQTVKQDSSLLINKIMVSEGDTVQKGDPLIEYDVTLFELELREKKNNLAVIEDNIKHAKKEITRLQNLQPSEAMPPMPEPTMPPVPEKPQVSVVDRIVDPTSAVSGSGVQNDPYLFNCSENTVVSGEFLQYLLANGSFANFNVYIDNSLSYMWSVSGANIPAEVSEWVVGTGVETDGIGNVSVDLSAPRFGSFKAFSAAEDEPEINDIPQMSFEEYQQSISSYSDDYIYSRAELAQMISQKQKEIKTLEIERKSADVEYRKAKAQSKDGILKSNIDGIVTKVNDGSDPENTDPDVLVVQGNSGLSITATIGEYDLDKISEGTIVSVTSYETGAMASAEIKSIDMTPVENYYNWNGNPNSSGYSFTADIMDAVEGFNVDQWVGVNLIEEQAVDVLYIPVHYTREENDKYYVFKEGKGGKLEKQYIKTGAIIYDSIEIKDGLSIDDKICFPYGKNIEEGIKTRETDKVEW